MIQTEYFCQSFYHIGKEGKPTENLQLNAGFDVLLPYDAFINGKDTQIEKAVEEMLKAIGKK